MISEAEFQQAVRAFMSEMSMMCVSESPESLRAIPGFRGELEEARALFRDERTPDQVVLSTAFGLVDEYVERVWRKVITSAYASYLAEHGGAEPQVEADIRE